MIFSIYKRVLSDKILLFLNILTILIIISTTYKFFQSNKEISTFYLNFIIYFSFILFILFVILTPDKELDENLKNKIKFEIRKNVSPRHVPSKIISVHDIPKTKNGKTVELAIKNTIEGQPIKNKEALLNPQSLDEFKNLKELI